MRLDIYLKMSRLVSRRTLAQAFCDAGRIEINGATAKPSKAVSIGDVIKLNGPARETVVRVTCLPAVKQLAKSDAASLYELVSDESSQLD